jgi:hypothetical protein
MMALRKLTIEDCPAQGIIRLFEALTHSFASGDPQLKSLQIKQTIRTKSGLFADTLNALLLSFRGLQELFIYDGDCRKVDVAAVVNHGSTLKTLILLKGDPHKFDPVKPEIIDMLSHCLNVEQLCMDLYDLQHNKCEGDNPDFVAPPSTHSSARSPLEAAFTTIATLPKLHTLRITDSKIHRCGTDADLDITDMQLRRMGNGSQRYQFQATADTLMQYLHKQGSELKLLAFSPLDYFGKPHDPDVNGHYWPHYHYYKATFTDGLGINTAVVRPLRNLKVEFPESWVLNEFEYEWEEMVV